ncbi:MAG: hypothetical protein NTV72_00520 [Candidatus Taylorbacteria bacterium]|nr:hypothetical protein [Candidatus Taylorbacteria bacterium]
MNSKIPQTLKPYFWSYDFSKIDPDKSSKTVVSQIINYGNISDWKWLVSYYGIDSVRQIIINLRPGEIKKRTLKLASLIFNFNLGQIKSNAL